jgi:hypothetical protein
MQLFKIQIQYDVFMTLSPLIVYAVINEIRGLTIPIQTHAHTPFAFSKNEETTWFITRKLVNTNKNINEIFLSIFCDNLFRQNFTYSYPSVNTDRKIISVYTKGIAVRK